MKVLRNTLLALALGTVAIQAADVLATVNGKQITSEDAERFIRAANPKQSFAAVSDSDKKIIIDRLVERVLFAEAAKKAGIEKDPNYQKALAIAKDELAINQWMQNKYNAAVVSDSEAKEFYEKNKMRFQKPAQVRARHILVKEEDEAKRIIETLKPLTGDALKKKFVELAKSKSTGPSGTKGGDLGYFGQKQMVPEFDKAVFALKKGEITLAPVKTQFGYHIIYLEDKKAAETVPYETVKPQIVQNLKQVQFKEMLKKSAEELKSKAKIELGEGKK